MEKRESSYSVAGNANDTATMENSMVTPSKTRKQLPYDPTVPLLGTCTLETVTEKDTCTPVFIAALFTVVRVWQQPVSPLTDEWIKKLWYIHTMGYYSATKRNTVDSVLIRWLNLEPIIQSESQKEKKTKNKYCILRHIYEYMLLQGSNGNAYMENRLWTQDGKERME